MKRNEIPGPAGAMMRARPLRRRHDHAARSLGLVILQRGTRQPDKRCSFLPPDSAFLTSPSRPRRPVASSPSYAGAVVGRERPEEGIRDRHRQSLMGLGRRASCNVIDRWIDCERGSIEKWDKLPLLPLQAKTTDVSSSCHGSAAFILSSFEPRLR
jgi:hypothetical protein